MPKVFNVGNINANLTLQDQMSPGIHTAIGNLGVFTRITGPGGSVLLAVTGLALAVSAVADAFVDFARKALEASFDFQVFANNLDAVTSATDLQSEAMRRLATQLAGETKFSATELAKGMNFLGTTGLSVNQILEATPAITTLAAAGMTSMETAADIATNTMKGMGLEVSDLDRVVDVMAKTATSANTTIEKMGSAFPNVAATASAAGLSLEDVATAIGLLGDRGIAASKIGTDLRAVILRLSSPTKKAAETMQKYGISAHTASGHLLPLPQLMGHLSERMENLDPKEQAAVRTALFGQRAQEAAGILIRMGEPAIQKFKNSLLTAGGTAKEMADTQMKGLVGVFERIRSAVDSAWIEIGNKLTPAMQSLEPIVHEAVALFKQMGLAVAREVVPAVEALLPFLKEALRAIKDWIPVLKKMWNDNLKAVFIVGLTMVARYIQDFTEKLDSAREAVEWFQKWARKLGGTWMGVLTWFTGATKSVSGFKEKVDDAKDSSIDFLTSMENLSTASDDYIEAMKLSGQWTAEHARQLEILKEIQEDALLSTMSLEQALYFRNLRIGQEEIRAIETQIAELDRQLKDAGGPKGGAEDAKQKIEDLRKKWLELYDKVEDARVQYMKKWRAHRKETQRLIDEEIEAAGKYMEGVFTQWEDDWTDYWEEQFTIPEEPKTSIMQELRELLPKWSDMGKEFGKTVGKQFMKHMGDAMESMWEKIKSKFQKWFGDELGALMSSLAQSIGDAFMRELGNNIGTKLAFMFSGQGKFGGGGAGGGGGGFMGMLGNLFGGGGAGAGGFMGAGGTGVGLLSGLGTAGGMWAGGLGAAWGGASAGAGAGFMGLGNLMGGAGLKGLLAAIPGWGWALGGALLLGSVFKDKLFGKGYDDLSDHEKAGKHLQEALGLGHRKDSPFSDQFSSWLVGDATRRGDRFDVLTSFRANLEAAYQDLGDGASQFLGRFADEYLGILASIDAGKFSVTEGMNSMAAAFDDLLADAVKFGNTDAFATLAESLVATMNRVMDGTIPLESAQDMLVQQYAMLKEVASQFGETGTHWLSEIANKAKQAGIDLEKALTESTENAANAMAEALRTKIATATQELATRLADAAADMRAEYSALQAELQAEFAAAVEESQRKINEARGDYTRFKYRGAVGLAVLGEDEFEGEGVNQRTIAYNNAREAFELWEERELKRIRSLEGTDAHASEQSRFIAERNRRQASLDDLEDYTKAANALTREEAEAALEAYHDMLDDKEDDLEAWMEEEEARLAHLKRTGASNYDAEVTRYANELRLRRQALAEWKADQNEALTDMGIAEDSAYRAAFAAFRQQLRDKEAELKAFETQQQEHLDRLQIQHQEQLDALKAQHAEAYRKLREDGEAEIEAMQNELDSMVEGFGKSVEDMVKGLTDMIGKVTGELPDMAQGITDAIATIELPDWLKTLLGLNDEGEGEFRLPEDGGEEPDPDDPNTGWMPPWLRWWNEQRGFSQGTGYMYRDFGRGSLAMLHGREAVVTQAQGKSLAADLHRAVAGNDRQASEERQAIITGLRDLADRIESAVFTRSIFDRDDALSAAAY